MPILAEEIPSFDNGGLARDGTAVTWHLKKGVVWHDGKPFTADDVIFTWEYAADPATGAVTSGSYQNIKHIDKLDEHTVKVMFIEPTPFWYDAFCGGRGQILPKHLVGEYKGQHSRNSPYNLKPVGTGPYKMVEFKPGDVALYEINPTLPCAQPPLLRHGGVEGGWRCRLGRARRDADRGVRLCLEPAGGKRCAGAHRTAGDARQGGDLSASQCRAHPAQSHRSLDRGRR